MMDLNDLLVRIDATTEQLRREMKRAESTTDQTARRIDRSLERIDRKFSAIARQAAVAGAAMAGFAAAAGGAKLVQVARETDILDAQLKTATGSAEAAARAFGMLEQFAAETPFQLQEVVNAFVKLKNLGLDPSEEALRSYGNTASAMGKSLDQFIEAVADAATAEFERLKEFGIRAKNQGDTIDFTFRGITTTVRNNANEIEGYLRDLGEQFFPTAMRERAESLDGALSNLQDSWDALFRTIGQGPIGDAIESHVRKGIRAIERLERKVAMLQGTATPEQVAEEQLDNLFVQRAQLESELSKFAEGSPGAEKLIEQIEVLKLRIESAKDSLAFFRKDIQDRGFGNLIEPIDTSAFPNRRDFSYDISAIDTKGFPKKRKHQRGQYMAGYSMDDAFIDDAIGKQREAERIFASTRTEIEQIEAQIARVKELSAGGFFEQAGINDQQILERLQAQLEEVGAGTDRQMNDIAQSIATNFTGAFDEMFTEGELSLENFTNAVLRDLARITAQLYIMKPLIEGLFGAGGGSTQFGQALYGAFGFAKGGSFTVGGSGGPDSQFVPLKLSPGEHVKISPPGKGSSDTVVQVFDQRGNGEPPVKVEEVMSGMQRMIQVTVPGAVAGMFANGSMDRLMSASGMRVPRRGS